ncbi:GlxA family transcriptional regulator [Chitinophaga caseinilytica]|uniref:GlxA family transcriptional regulator n=1 Tax=Chitinophaga caseinilytica TaxID=2267521 RepID=UPI003C2D5005
MKHLSILVPDDRSGPNTVACIAGTYHAFSEANKYYGTLGRKPVFKMELVGLSKRSELVNGMLMIQPQESISTIRKTDLIIIPALGGEFLEKNFVDEKVSAWLRGQYKKGAEIASMCTGAYMLAATDLLNGKNCSVHWKSAESFHQLFPEVQLKIEKLITDEEGIYTNGGGYSFLNLLIYLIGKYYDRQTAVYCSKVLQVEIDRQTQSDFAIFSGQKKHGDDMIRKAQEYMEHNYDRKISVDELSKELAFGRRTFDRRFIKATGNTPAEYLQRLKIESAKKALESTPKTVNEIMYEVGYSDAKAFREVFRKITGISPLAYKNKYNREAAELLFMNDAS